MSTSPHREIAITAADQIDQEFSALRASGQRHETVGGKPVGTWIWLVARRANRLYGQEIFGVKATTPAHPISYDTIGIKLHRLDSDFYAVSLCRDGDDYRRRIEDHGLVTTGQSFWYIGMEPGGAIPPEPSPIPPPADPTPPYVSTDERIAQALESLAYDIHRLVVGSLGDIE